MADIVLGSVERIIKVAFKIKDAIETVRQNEEECQNIEEVVATVIANLSQLQVMEVTNHPAMNSALMGLEKAMDRALKVFTKCQKRHIVRRLVTAGDMTRQLGRVQDDILRKVSMCTFAVTVEYFTFTVQCSGAHAPLTQPQLRLLPWHIGNQDAGEVDMSYNSHSTTGHARSGVNSEITMFATGSEVPSVPLSEFTLSKLEATTQRFSEEKITGGGGHSRVYMMQKIVIKVHMTCSKSQTGAMVLAIEKKRYAFYSTSTRER